MLGCIGAFLAQAASADDTLRLGLIAFGTGAWEVDVMRRHGLDKAAGLRIDKIDLADPAAAEIALQAGAVDAILSDWLWVSRQRNAGQRIVFVPHSTLLGEVMVPNNSPIASFAGLAGKRLGVAGGPLDKSWLLLRAYARRKTGRDLAEQVEPVFAAPPLLSQELVHGRLDAVLTFWPFAARLEALGFRRLVSMEEVMGDLGFSPPAPMLGYAFSETWVSAHGEAARRFLLAASQADKLMGDDAEWEALKPLIGAPDDATLAALRRRFQAGIVIDPAGAAAAAARLYALLAEIGGPGLTGGAPAIAPGTFWQGGPS